MFKKKSKLVFDWSKIEASAPGRFVLMGDYNDLDERSAIAVALDCRLRVTIRPHREDGKLRLTLKDFNDVREWPLSLPIFSMTKLVAHYADTLAYTDSMQRNLKPLLNPKYRNQPLPGAINESPIQAQETDNDSSAGDHATKNTVTFASDANGGVKPVNSSSSNSIAQAPIVVSPIGEHSKLDDDKRHANFKHDKIHDTLLPQDAKNFQRAEVSLIEHADAANSAFLILYLALSDSFAGSIRPSLDIEIESRIPIGRGLGSSTAYAAALTAALMKVFRVSAEPTIIMDWTQNIDKFFHSETSGLHSSVVVNGGYIYFQHKRLKHHGIPHLLPLKALLIDTGIRRDPRFINSTVTKNIARRVDSIYARLNEMDEQVSQSWRRLNDPQFKPTTINENLRRAQEILDKLSLSHRKIYELCLLARVHSLTVKQTQAGETVFLLHDEMDDASEMNGFRDNLRKLGYEFEDRYICSSGLKVTTTTLDRQIPPLDC